MEFLYEKWKMFRAKKAQLDTWLQKKYKKQKQKTIIRKLNQIQSIKTDNLRMIKSLSDFCRYMAILPDGVKDWFKFN